MLDRQWFLEFQTKREDDWQKFQAQMASDAKKWREDQAKDAKKWREDQAQDAKKWREDQAQDAKKWREEQAKAMKQPPSIPRTAAETEAYVEANRAMTERMELARMTVTRWCRTCEKALRPDESGYGHLFAHGETWNLGPDPG